MLDEIGIKCRHIQVDVKTERSKIYAHPCALDAVPRMVRKNVVAQLANPRTRLSVALALEQGRMNLHGWVYDIETGSIDALDGATRRFVALAESPTTVAVTSRNLRQV
ncbi:carbonic anhydrase [Ralstonia holmesii]|uniref:Carbonic anhydrase n=2 Tax=Burkholderiaceae TaxID=119060 RepID=A0ABC8QMN8_9RALS|nr:carbonic anhydrase [Ralstonia sp. LMG 32967]CAJ0700612.1 hypothetical protein R11007_03339 [Ralstonia sp. LMG 32967]CAJ0807535.1 hypothetical protein LMG18096_04967 [Ralstonia sp. LMG 32967]CAJ0821861.1 hypothetical protein LMG18093_04845 [Ralstonia sp. LMG 32967]